MATNDTFESGVLWQTGDLVTADLLKDTVENATPKKALIDGLTATGSIDPANDTMMVKSVSDDDLRKVTIDAVLNSEADVTFDNIKVQGAIISDIFKTDANGVIQPNVEVQPQGGNTSISGSYNCVSGVVTITPVGVHNIKENDIINVSITGGNANIVGEFRTKTGTSSTSIIYDSRDASVANSAGSCTFDIKGSLKVNVSPSGNSPSPISVGNVYANNAFISNNSTVKGNSTVIGNQDIKGTLSVGGAVTAATVPTTGSHLTNKTYVDGTSSKTTNGYVILPNGLIMQWGVNQAAVGTYGMGTITFPIPFPTACLNVQITQQIQTYYGGGAAFENGIKINGSPTNTQFIFYVNYGGSQGQGSFQSWFAIGY